MLDVKIWIGNLGKYNEGSLVGRWVDLPCYDLDQQIQAVLGSPAYEEVAIFDSEGPLEINEYDNIHSLNEKVERLEELVKNLGIDENILSLIIDTFVTLEEAMLVLENEAFRVFYDCKNMEDVARECIEESGFLTNIPEEIARYFDYQSYGKDMEGTFKIDRTNEIVVEIF